MIFSGLARGWRASGVAVFSATLALTVVSCAGTARPTASTGFPEAHSAAPGGTLAPAAFVPAIGGATDHVIIVSIDGLRPDAIGRFGAVTVDRLAREGSFTFAATTITPSTTLPSHTSMLTGERPERHGITWNTNETDSHATLAVPTVFGVARESGLRTAAFFSKGKFNHLDVPGSLDYTQAPGGNGKWSSDRTVRDVERYLAAERPNLLFVHFGEPDYSGHVWGWMSWLYGRSVRKADAAVARLLVAADRAFGAGNYTVILTADHGGHGRSHASARPENVTIPWIAWGEGVDAGERIDGAVRTMDTAGTALWLLGLNAPGGWSGVPVRDAFTGTAQAAVDLAEQSTVR